MRSRMARVFTKTRSLLQTTDNIWRHRNTRMLCVQRHEQRKTVYQVHKHIYTKITNLNAKRFTERAGRSWALSLSNKKSWPLTFFIFVLFLVGVIGATWRASVETVAGGDPPTPLVSSEVAWTSWKEMSVKGMIQGNFKSLWINIPMRNYFIGREILSIRTGCDVRRSFCRSVTASRCGCYV